MKERLMVIFNVIKIVSCTSVNAVVAQTSQSNGSRGKFQSQPQSLLRGQIRFGEALERGFGHFFLIIWRRWV